LEVDLVKPKDAIWKDTKSTDLAINFIDWAPHPPDASTGKKKNIMNY